MKENLEAEKAGEAASMSYTEKLEEKMLANAKESGGNNTTGFNN
jgi:hypothetical protein